MRPFLDPGHLLRLLLRRPGLFKRGMHPHFHAADDFQIWWCRLFSCQCGQYALTFLLVWALAPALYSLIDLRLLRKFIFVDDFHLWKQRQLILPGVVAPLWFLAPLLSFRQFLVLFLHSHFFQRMFLPHGLLMFGGSPSLWWNGWDDARHGVLFYVYVRIHQIQIIFGIQVHWTIYYFWLTYSCFCPFRFDRLVIWAFLAFHSFSQFVFFEQLIESFFIDLALRDFAWKVSVVLVPFRTFYDHAGTIASSMLDHHILTFCKKWIRARLQQRMLVAKHACAPSMALKQYLIDLSLQLIAICYTLFQIGNWSITIRGLLQGMILQGCFTHAQIIADIGFSWACHGSDVCLFVLISYLLLKSAQSLLGCAFGNDHDHSYTICAFAVKRWRRYRLMLNCQGLALWFGSVAPIMLLFHCCWCSIFTSQIGLVNIYQRGMVELIILDFILFSSQLFRRSYFRQDDLIAHSFEADGLILDITLRILRPQQRHWRSQSIVLFLADWFKFHNPRTVVSDVK